MIDSAGLLMPNYPKETHKGKLHEPTFINPVQIKVTLKYNITVINTNKGTFF